MKNFSFIYKMNCKYYHSLSVNRFPKLLSSNLLLNFSKRSNKNFSDQNIVNITYQYLGGKEVRVKAPIGENLLIIAKNNNVELEGACECSLACSTCHLILEQSLYDKLEEPTEDETNLLSLSGNYCETSRLGCQIKASKELEGCIFKIPFDPI